MSNQNKHSVPSFKEDEEMIRKSLFANCRSVSNFEKIATQGEGTYGTVYSARDKSTGEIFAIKKLKIHDNNYGFPITSLREINLLKQLSVKFSHPNIIRLHEVVVGARQESVFLVFEYCDLDLSNLVDTMYISKEYFSECEVKCQLFQLLNAINYQHENHIVHRDLKMSNLLLNSNGILKLADFGLSKQFESNIRRYTKGVVTQWYRSPEILLEMDYDHYCDVWSVGCIFGELLHFGRPILPGKNELNQFDLMCALIGYPKKENWPEFFDPKILKKQVFEQLKKYQFYKDNRIAEKFEGVSPAGQDLLSKLLQWNPANRISIKRALLHPYFYEKPLPTMPEQLRCLSKIDTYKKKIRETAVKKLKHN